MQRPLALRLAVMMQESIVEVWLCIPKASSAACDSSVVKDELDHFVTYGRASYEEVNDGLHSPMHRTVIGLVRLASHKRRGGCAFYTTNENK